MSRRVRKSSRVELEVKSSGVKSVNAEIRRVKNKSRIELEVRK